MTEQSLGRSEAPREAALSRTHRSWVVAAPVRSRYHLTRSPEWLATLQKQIMNSKQLIFVINLESRSDRRIAMKRQLSKIGWNAEFFRAIRPKESAGFPSIGACGCFLSHLSVLKKAHHAGADHVIILEDDLNFEPAFTESWNRAMSLLACQEWSLFYPGHTLKGLPVGLSRIASQTGVQCTHFMAINRPALSTLIAGLETILARPPGHPLGGPMHLDGAYSTLRAQNDALVTYAYAPTLGYQRPSRTDIGRLRWFDRFAPLSLIANLVRKARAGLPTTRNDRFGSGPRPQRGLK